MQLTLKVVLNLRPDEEGFYNTILHCTHDILTKGVDNEDAQMEVNTHDLEEAEAAVSFAEKTGSLRKHQLQNPPHLQIKHLLRPRDHLSHLHHMIS